ncbi:MAG: NEW3 domain-containing protein [Bacteroidales bacterium]
MSSRTKWFLSFCILILGGLPITSYAMSVSDSVTLYTPYTRISVPPGESVTYSIDLINNTKSIKKVDLYLTGMPKGWISSLTSGGYSINQISVMPGEKKNLSLSVNIPLKVNKGNYRFSIVAKGYTTLPVTINVSEQGTFKTEFTSDQANMQGNTSSTFNFNSDLKNLTSERQSYALMAKASPGWEVTFRANGKQVTSVEIEPNNTSRINIEIKPPANTPAGTYEIPVKAMTSSTSGELRFQMVITGTYSMNLTTPSGLLSTTLTAGESKKIELVVINTGSTILNKVNIVPIPPVNWEVTCDPKTIEKIAGGEKARVTVTLKADKKAIPGDYITNFEAQTQELVAKASFRVSVKTSLVWGWVGMLIIAAALGSVYYLFRKYGRR